MKNTQIAFGTHADGTRAYWPLTEPDGTALAGTVTGPINSGKTNLLQVLGHAALQAGIKVWSWSKYEQLPGQQMGEDEIFDEFPLYQGRDLLLVLTDGPTLGDNPRRSRVALINTDPIHEDQYGTVRASMNKPGFLKDAGVAQMRGHGGPQEMVYVDLSTPESSVVPHPRTSR